MQLPPLFNINTSLEQKLKQNSFYPQFAFIKLNPNTKITPLLDSNSGNIKKVL